MALVLFKKMFKNSKKCSIYLLNSLLVLLFCTPLFATINVEVDPPFAAIHEPFRVTYTMENPKNRITPDFSALQKEFIVLGTEQTSQYNNINGQIEVLYQWSVILMAKKTGLQTVPSINLGGIKTPIAHVEISSSQSAPQSHNQRQNTIDNSISNDTSNDSIKLKTEVDNKKSLVNQQIIYTVKLYNNGQLLDTDYHPPQAENALLIPLKNGYRYHTNENGQNYMVEAQSYAIFPQKTGQINITGPLFNALVFENMPRRVKLTGKNLKVEVGNIPKEFNNNNWLPAKSLFLKDNFAPNVTKFSEGDTLERTLKIEATGIPAELIPEFTFKESPQFDLYQEKPELDNSLRQQNVVGTVKLKINYILHTSGTVTIPEINIPWYNTITGKKEIATFPARTLHIIPKITTPKKDDTNKSLKKFNQINSKDNDANISLEKSLEDNTNSIISNSNTTRFFSLQNFIWLLIGFLSAFAALLIINAFSDFQNKQKKIRTTYKKLKVACKNNQALEAKNALLSWFQLKGISAQNLDELIQKIEDPTLKEELQILSKAIYSQNTKTIWQGNSLMKSINAYHFKKNKKTRIKDDIPPMNPK